MEQKRRRQMKKGILLLTMVLVLTTGCLIAPASPTKPATTPTVKPETALQFSALEPFWSEWVKRNVTGSLEVYCQSSGGNIVTGVHVEQGQSMSFDASGNLIPPTSDGALLTFRTENGCTYGWVNGIQIQANDSLTLRVSKDVGLIYESGSGKVTLPTGETLDFGTAP
jgi:hypothetical protein